MHFPHFSLISQTNHDTILSELADLGFVWNTQASDKDNLQAFVYHCYFLYDHAADHCHNLIARDGLDLQDFFDSEETLTETIFYHIAYQLLGFVPEVDYTDPLVFKKETDFPVTLEQGLLVACYYLLAMRMKSGNLLVEALVSDGIIPEDNHYHFFNGKALATFDTKTIYREVVYVETPVDTDHDGRGDLIKVSILRPRVSFPVPVVMTQSPYHQGVNDKASDAKLHPMAQDLAVKEPHTITVSDPHIPTIVTTTPDLKAPHSPTEKVGHIASYSLNDYFLARGFANIYVSGIGTLGSEGFMTSGDYQQVLAYKAVIDWLNGRACAFTGKDRSHQVVATWATGKVVTTGISYLGTLSNALATTGVEGLEVIISEAGISSWYDYYRDNGLVASPGGYPGEDLDSLAALTYSRSLQAGDWLKMEHDYQEAMADMLVDLDRKSGDYNQFWHDRNYLPQAKNVTCEVVFTHGSQDWNVQPQHVYRMFHALPDTIHKHLFFHHGAHVYMNHWQSIDFRESMNALLCKRLLNLDNHYHLPTVIWQDNNPKNGWHALDDFASQHEYTFALGQGHKTIHNRYDIEAFNRYASDYCTFHQDLYQGKTPQACITLTLPEDKRLNGPITLRLRLKSSSNKGLLSCHLLHRGKARYLQAIPTPIERLSVDNGRFFSQQDLVDLPYREKDYRLLTKGYLNLQNRANILEVKSITPDEWMTLEWDLQPTIYQLKKGDTLDLYLFTTDFEVTIRDNTDYHLTLDLEASSMILPNSN